MVAFIVYNSKPINKNYEKRNKFKGITAQYAYVFADAAKYYLSNRYYIRANIRIYQNKQKLNNRSPFPFQDAMSDMSLLV